MDSTASCELLSFLDVYSDYHQINLAKDDEEKITFITPFRIFCYTKMAFGLKTGEGGTYQKCVHIVLETQIGRNVEAIDDIVVKSKKRGDLLNNLKETFDNLCKYKMIFNPKNVYLMCHQKNCSTTWCRPEG
jgi:hypothetical protein